MKKEKKQPTNAYAIDRVVLGVHDIQVRLGTTVKGLHVPQCTIKKAVFKKIGRHPKPSGPEELIITVHFWETR